MTFLREYGFDARRVGKNDADAVVITNNRVTAEARTYAKALGVEIIADAELQEIEQVYKSNKLINNKHTGLIGIKLSTIVDNKDLLLQSIGKKKPELPSDKEQLKLKIISDYDTVISYSREAARLLEDWKQLMLKSIYQVGLRQTQ